ncbi:MAG: hypothetical protein V1701_11885 [Planctomycetota bacterium]
MNNSDERNIPVAAEPEIPKELEGMLKATFRKIAPSDAGVANCKLCIAGLPKPVETIWLYPILYPAAAVILSILSVWLLIGHMVPDGSQETQLVADTEIKLADGTLLGVGKDSSIKIEEKTRTLVLEKGWVRVNCPATGNQSGQNKLRIIAPSGTVINKGNNFTTGYSSSSRTFSVWGSIEILTSN